MIQTTMQDKVVKLLGYTGKKHRTSNPQWIAAAELLCQRDVLRRVYEDGALYFELTPLGRDLYQEMKEK